MSASLSARELHDQHEDERNRHRLRQRAEIEKASRDAEERRWRRRVLPLLPYSEAICNDFEGCIG